MANIFEFKGHRPVIHKSAFIHPNATVTGNVVIGRNVYIGPGAAIRGDWGKIIIEDGCNVQENCTIHMFPGTTVTCGQRFTLKICSLVLRTAKFLIQPWEIDTVERS